MRIGIDVRAASHTQPGGFKTYTRNLIYWLPRVDADNSYIFYADRTMDTAVFDGLPNVTLQVVPCGFGPLGVVSREQIGLPVHLSRQRIHLAHFPVATAPLICPCPFVVTIHDTIGWDDRPRLARLPLGEAAKRIGIHVYDSLTSRIAAKHGRFIITVSENSKRDILTRTGLAPERVHVIYPAPSPLFSAVANQESLDRVCESRGVGRRFIMGLSSASPRKNAAKLVESYVALGPHLVQEYQLVIVWTHELWRNEIEQLANSQGLQHRILFLTGVSDEELRALYNMASVFVFPSLYEGFGMPPLEAMACGTPVVAANSSCLSEVVGDAALLVDPHSAEDIAEAIAAILAKPDLQGRLRESGLRRAGQFSWEATARKTVDVYLMAAKETEEA